MIKEIRRGNREAAAYWAYHMSISGQEAVEFMWESLAVCAMEDVGLAEPNAINVVMSAKQACFDMPTGYVGRHLAATFAVTYLAECPKSRLVDEMLFDMIQRLEEEGGWREIPDYALDHHTKRGREMGRDEEFFFTEASKLHNDVSYPSDRVYRERILERILARKGKKQ